MPLQQAAVGPFARTGSRTFEGESRFLEVSGEWAEIAGMGGPAYEARLVKFQQVGGCPMQPGCCGIGRNDFQIVFLPSERRALRVPRPGWTPPNAARTPSALFDESDAAVEIVAAEKDVIEHRQADQTLAAREKFGRQERLRPG